MGNDSLSFIDRSLKSRPNIAGCLGWFTTLLLLLAHFPIASAEPPASNTVDFNRDIRPVFQQRCFACHGALKQQAGLRLDTASAILRGSDSGKIIEVNQSASSLLIHRLKSSEPEERMPPEGQPLEESQILAIAEWIDRGAIPPPNDLPELDPNQHWSFQIPNRPALPLPTESSIRGNPIDAFIEHRWNQHGVTPQPIADPATRLRRVYLDLIGLPPSPEALKKFEQNPTQSEYERVVDELLASPKYGERWGRHWMDVWRYADWFGRRYVPDVWNSAPQIWRWRDWIVQSLNDDAGYDQMLREMLAADEIHPGDPKSAVATGYLIRNWYALNPNDWMRSNVEHVGKAFLGLTFHCAHCHDHKYDPISQENYFQFRAFFEPISVRQDRVCGQADPGPFQEYEYSTLRKVQRLGRVSVFDKNPETPTWFYTGGDERNRLTDRGSISPAVPEFLKSAFQQPIAKIQLPPKAWYPGLDDPMIAAVLGEADTAIANANLELSTAQSKLQESSATSELPKQEREAIEKSKVLEAQIQLARQSYNSSKPSVLSGEQSLLFDASTGRRMIYRSAPEITSVEENDEIHFLVQILADSHFNFQLTRNSPSGATATYVGFERGKIKSYKPSSFDEFEVGKFEVGTSPVMLVHLTLHPKADQCTLTVSSPDSQHIYVDPTTIALNGWNPSGDPNKGILFDARPGSVAVVDDWKYLRTTGTSPSATSLLAFDFEPTTNPENAELVGTFDWVSAQNYSLAPACSKVVRNVPDMRLRQLETELAHAKRLAIRGRLPVDVAAAKVASAQANRSSLEARILAEQSKYFASDSASAEQIELLSRNASIAEKLAELEKARWDWLEAKRVLADIESKPEDEPNRAKELETSTQRFATMQSSMDAADLAFRHAQEAPASSASYKPLSAQYPKTSTGRRKALAEWITSTKNPLSARVGVNHIWMRHFHQPLVKSVFDFGRNGSLPSHPELLDWLAVEWVESGWSMKRLHRLMVTCQTYQRQSFAANNQSQQMDPENQWYWRMNTGRMEVEVVRDSLIELAGKLDPTMGGQELENKDIFTTWRRTLYYSCQPEEDGKSQLGMLFDGPDASDCYRRTRTVIPQQSLALTNSPLVHELSPLIAKRIETSWTSSKSISRSAFVVGAFRRILNRAPTAKEKALCEEYISKDPDQSSQRISLVRALLNHTDFITIR